MKLEITYEYLMREGYKPYYKNGYLKINGSFSCNYNHLTELIIPDNFAVCGGFYCYNNKLTKLTIPDNFVIGGNFSCDNNQLIELIIPDNFTVNGNFYCGNNKLTKLIIPDNFVINGYFCCDNNQLKELTIPDNLVINGNFYCDNNQLTEQPKLPNILKQGYHGRYCYYDNILRSIKKVKTIDGYTVYVTPFDVVMVDENENSAHGKTVKEARRDLIFKTTKRDTNQYRNINIEEERDLDYLYVAYRNITGSCKLGTEEFMMQNNINEDNRPKSIKEVIELTCNKKAYRSDVFKEFFSRD